MNNNDPSFNHRVSVELAQHLGVKPVEVLKYLTVKIGDTVAEGDILAKKKKSMLGFSTLEIKSPVAGIITQIDDLNGTILIEAKTAPAVGEEPVGTEEEQSNSMDDPNSVSVVEPSITEETITVESVAEPEPESPTLAEEPTPEVTFQRQSRISQPPVLSSNHLQGIFGFGKGQGRGIFLEAPLLSGQLTASLKGGVVLVTQIPTLHLMYKASAIGIEAIVVTSTDIASAELFAKELDGRAQVGLLLLPEEVDIKKLAQRFLIVDGAQRTLTWS